MLHLKGSRSIESDIVAKQRYDRLLSDLGILGIEYNTIIDTLCSTSPVTEDFMTDLENFDFCVLITLVPADESMNPATTSAQESKPE